ncbi:flagellar export chaperone FliS [Desulfocurvus sp. DL9XJH121]
MLKGAKAYFQTQVSTTTQGDLLILLYDGAIKFLSQAKDKMAEKDYAQKGILISKAIDVIGELDSSLNPEKGGEVAQNLHQLYFYCNTRLLRANLEMNPDLLDEVIRILAALREAFDKIKNEAPAVAPPAASAAAPTANPGLMQQPGAPTASAAHAAAAYGAPQRPTAPAARDEDAPAEPQPQASGISPVPDAPRPGPRLVRRQGLPGAYGNPGGTA